MYCITYFVDTCSTQAAGNRILEIRSRSKLHGLAKQLIESPDNMGPIYDF